MFSFSSWTPSNKFSSRFRVSLRERYCGHELQVVAVAPELLARRRLQVREGILCAETVGEAKSAQARAAGTVAAHQAKALEPERGTRSIAAFQLPGIAERIAVAEFSDAGELGFRARVHSDGSPPAEMARSLADQQVAAEDRDDRARRREKLCVRKARPPGECDGQGN